MGRAERVTELADAVRPVALAADRLLPVPPALAGLLPEGGLRRGTTVGIGCRRGPGTTTLALALAAGASAAGSWCAVVGVPDLGLVAAAEQGLDLERVALLPHVPPGQWVTVIGLLVGAIDIVVVRAPAHLRLGNARRIGARVRQHSSVLVVIGRWPEAVDVDLAAVSCSWDGLGQGHGHLGRRRIDVVAQGRRAAARQRRVALWLPAPPAAEPRFEARCDVASAG
jgi:hypothetical protein